MSEHERHDLGSMLGSQMEIFTEMAELESQLEDPTLRPDQIKGVKAKCLVITFTSDWLYPSYQSKQMVKAMKTKGASK